MKTALITGGAGFLGSHLCERLLRDGMRVIAMDNYYTGRKETIAPFFENPQFKFIAQNIIEPFDVNEPIDYVLNFACPASPPQYQRDPLYTLNVCFLGVKNALEVAKKHRAVFLQASTSEVYGDPTEHPQKESYWGNVNPFGPRSCYDEGKRVGETLSLEYARMHRMSVKIARIFNAYGPRMDAYDGRVVSNFIVQALSGDPITIYGSGEQTRSFCYVDDLIEGIVLLLKSAPSVTGPMNIGSEFEFSVRSLAETIVRLTGSSSRITERPLPEDDPKRRRADITRAKTTLAWEPSITLEEGLMRTIDYFKNNGAQ